MKAVPLVLGAAILLTTVGSASAQEGRTPMTPLEIAVACAPPPVHPASDRSALRVIGAQDTVPRTLFDASDLLVINGGTSVGLQLGQAFYVRRENHHFGGVHGVSVRTLGWIRIVAASTSTAIARVEHGCDGILVGDYLEPFVAPVVAADAERDLGGGEPDFSALARVLAGDAERSTAGAGDLMLIDAGADRGLTPGVRAAIYREIRMPGLPLSSIGEVVVVSVGPSMSLTRVTRARDAVQSGDYVAIRK